jgi:competence protein ComEC
MRNLLFAAVSATFGVTAFSFYGKGIILAGMIYVVFLIFQRSLRIILFQLIFFLIFFSAGYISDHYHSTGYNGAETSFRIRLTEIPDINGDTLRAVVTDSTGEKLQLRYKIQTENEKVLLSEKFNLDISCPVTGTLEIPDRRRNENSFDYGFFLLQQNIHWILKADSIRIHECSKVSKGILTKIKGIRMAGISYIEHNVPKETRGYVTALLFGDRTLIDEGEQTAYQRLGLIHLLAISGLHISFLAGLIFYLGIRLGIIREHMKIMLVILIPIYAILSGGSPSVWRACLMAMIYFLFSLIKKEISLAASIIGVYLFLLLIQPNTLYNIGFQLSFAVTFSLIMSARIFSRFNSKILQLILISLICQISALPILLYNFYEISVLGVLLNVVFVPLYTLLLPLSILAILTHLAFPLIGDYLISLLNLLLTNCNEAAMITSKLPLATIVFGKPSKVIMCLLVLLILRIFFKWDKDGGLRHCKFYIVLLLILLCMQYNHQIFSPNGEIVFIDVGQGDSIFIRLPYNKGNYLIDTGGSVGFNQEDWRKKRSDFNTGSDIILPFLKSKGIHRIDKLLLTHPDSDHVGSVNELLEGIDVANIFIGKGAENKYSQKGVLQAAERRNVKISTLQQGDSWNKDSNIFYVLNPYQLEADSNNSSIVIWARIGGLNWLFTGDLGKSAEQDIIKRYPKLRTDVLKAGHHGSKTSSSQEFLDTVKPKAAIISAGKGNRYGHPHEEVMKLLKQRGVLIFRTDLQGGISYKYRNQTGTFSTAIP